MTFTHDDIQARLIDFLYGEIDGEARAAFDAHVAGCPSCRAEVTAFQKTRATAREVVRAPLADAVPAPVRARVREAVLREATARASAAASTSAPLSVAASIDEGIPAKKDSGNGARQVAARADGATLRWLAWLRSHWTLPALTTAAAMGALLLFREPLFREARRPLGDKTAEELMPGSASAPAPGTVASSSADRAPKGEGVEPDSVSEGQVTGTKLGSRGEGLVGLPPAEAKRESNKVADNGAGKASTDTRRRATPRARAGVGSGAGAGAAAANAKADSFGFDDGVSRGPQGEGTAGDQLLGKMRADKPARPADVKDAQPKPAKRNLDDLLEGTLSRSSPRPQASAPAAEKQLARAPAKSVSSSAAVEAEGDQDRERFAQPPPSVVRKAAAPAAAPSAPAPRAPVGQPTSARAAAEPSPVAGSAEEAPASTSRAKKGKASNKEERPLSDDESVVSANAPAESAAPPPSGAASRAPADPVTVLVDRAEKLMTARRWTQAAAAYRDLLQRFPQHASAPTWRRRLAAAQGAAAHDQNQPSDSSFATPPPPR